MNIYQKLHKIQERVIGLGKDKSALSYKYVTGDKVLSEIKPMMNDLGLLLKQEVISIENTRQDYLISPRTDKERPKSEIHSKVMMRFTWIDIETGDKDENSFGANGQNDWDKGVGSALTYGERYFLLKYFHIATDEDDIDNPDRKPEEQHGLNSPVTNPIHQPSQTDRVNSKDNRPWLADKAFASAMQRITAGEKDVYQKTVDAFRMKNDYKDQLKAAYEGVK
jgi:hypothetical protein